MRRSSLTIAALMCLVTAPARAAGGGSASGESEVCARSAEKAQDLRSAGKLQASLVELRACVRTSCPAFLRRDCAQWQADVEASMPTVVVTAHALDGTDMVAVRVTVDGAPFADRVDGLARPLDPGAHRFRFETEGAPAVEQSVVLREGEKRRAVDATFATHLGALRLPPEPPATADSSRGPWPWVFGGVGLVGLGVGAALAASGLSDYHGLLNGCGRTGACSPPDVSGVRTRLWIGDTLLVVGGISLGVASWLAFRPLPGGAAVQVGGAL
jgi:hypothetical protein